MKKGFIFGLLIVILIVIFVLQNAMPVEVTLFAWTFSELPLAALVLVAVLLGMMVSYFLTIPQMTRSTKERKRLQTELNKVKKEKEEIEIANSTQLPDESEK